MSGSKFHVVSVLFFMLFCMSPVVLAEQVSYEYDDYGRLTKASYDNGYALTQISYVYDNVGNFKTEGITKQIYPQIAVSPQPVDFGTIYSGTTSNQTITITNIGGDGLFVENLDISGTDKATFGIASNGCVGVMLPAGETCLIDITVAPTSTTEAGTKTATLALASNDANIPIQSVALNVMVSRPTLTVSKQGSTGTVTSTPGGISCGAVCETTFSGPTNVTLTAVADPGNLFVSWSGDCAGSSTICSLHIDRAINASATFSQTEQEFAVNLALIGSGSGSVLILPSTTVCGADCSALFPVNTRITLQPTASQYSIFSGWTGGACGGTVDCLFILDADKSTIAAFDRDVAHQVVIDSPPAYYSTVTEAYGAAANGNVIKLWDTVYSENLVLDRPVGLIIQGGYNESYSGITGETTLEGMLNISDGEVVIDGVAIR